MNLKELLLESAKELHERPSFFIPKLVTSIIGSLWMLGILYSTGDPFAASPSPNTQGLVLGLAASPFIMFIGILSPVIVAEMVKNNGNLIDATKRSLSYTPRLILTGILIFVGLTALMLPAYIGLLTFLASGNTFVVLIGTTISLISLILFTYGIYFIPIALTENSAVRSIEKSFKASKNYRKEVSLLLIFSFALLGLSMLSSGTARSLGAIGFILGRTVASALTTYVEIVSPKAYMELD